MLDDVVVMVAAQSPDVLSLMRQALTLASLREVRKHELARGGPPPPLVRDVDAVIVFGGAEAAHFIKACRDPGGSPNAYVPIVAVASQMRLSDVRALINAGAHEVLTMPFSAKSIRQRLQHAVFAGRPFVQTETYFGPCRRRAAHAAYDGPERRANAAADSAERAARDERIATFFQDQRATA